MAKKTEINEPQTEASTPDRDVNIMSAKLTIKQLGDPKKAAATFTEGDTQAKILLGYIYGRAEGVKRGKNPDQMSTHKYLVGLFEAEPVFNPKLPISRSGKCILNEAVQPEIENAFDVTDDKTGELLKEATVKGVHTVDFKLAVYVIYSTAALGYSWNFKWITTAQAADPLKELRNMTGDVKQLAAPKAETEAA